MFWAVEMAIPELTKTTLFCELDPLLFKIFIKIFADSEIELPPTIDLGFNILKSKFDGSNIITELLEMILTFHVRDTSS